MATTVRALLTSARTLMNTITVARDRGTTHFLEHKTNQPFESSSTSKRDGYEVVEREQKLTESFGLQGQEEGEFLMVVRVGHFPSGKDENREELKTEDVKRIADVFEAAVWPSGTRLVLFEQVKTNKDNANWWISEVFFKVVYVCDVLTP